MSKSFYAVVLLAAAGAAGGGYLYWGGLGAASTRADEIPTVEVRQGPFEVTLTSIGELRAAKSSVLDSPFEGKILKLLPEGSRVQPGDTVIWFETDQLEEDLKAKDAQLELEKKDLQGAFDAFELEKVKNQYTLETERTRVALAEQEFADAQQKHAAEKVLFERNISPQTKIDERRIALLQSELNLRNAKINLAKVEENLDANLRVSEREIEKARLRVDKTQDNVNEARRKLESALVIATTPGEISYLKIWKSGQTAKVTEGDQVWRRSNLVEIPDTSQMTVVLPVNELDISKVEPGQETRVTLIALPTQSFDAVVESKSIVPISDPTALSWNTTNSNQAGPREFEVKVRLREANELFRQGMTASAQIVIERLDKALQVPLEAISEQDGVAGVWLNETLGVKFEPIRILMSNDNFAAVDGNLNPGDRVFLSNPTTNSSTANASPLANAVEGKATPASLDGGG